MIDSSASLGSAPSRSAAAASGIIPPGIAVWRETAAQADIVEEVLACRLTWINKAGGGER
jgi:hypothetical protein